MAQRLLSVYIAGPDIFRADAETYCPQQMDVCRRYLFIPLHPYQDNANVGMRSRTAYPAQATYWENVCDCRRSDFVVANLNPYHGAEPDSGTAYEVGFAHAAGTVVYGYRASLEPFARLLRRFKRFTRRADGRRVDRDGYVLQDEFGEPLNLMLARGIIERGGKLVAGTFEDCIRTLRADIDAGLVTPRPPPPELLNR